MGEINLLEGPLEALDLNIKILSTSSNYHDILPVYEDNKQGIFLRTYYVKYDSFFVNSQIAACCSFELLHLIKSV